MKSFILRAVLEKDQNVWRVWIPELEAKGAETWGHTQEEALRNIQEVAQMVIEELQAGGTDLPEGITVSDSPLVVVRL